MALVEVRGQILELQETELSPSGLIASTFYPLKDWSLGYFDLLNILLLFSELFLFLNYVCLCVCMCI